MFFFHRPVRRFNGFLAPLVAPRSSGSLEAYFTSHSFRALLFRLLMLALCMSCTLSPRGVHALSTPCPCIARVLPTLCPSPAHTLPECCPHFPHFPSPPPWAGGGRGWACSGTWSDHGAEKKNHKARINYSKTRKK